MATIVVLDDVADAANMAARILQRKGHTVEAHTEEAAAIDRVKKGGVDLAILDIKLKKMTGIEVLAEMKKHDPDLKVIMLTGFPTVDTASRAQKLGAVDYCVKPIDKEELEDKVAAALES